MSTHYVCLPGRGPNYWLYNTMTDLDAQEDELLALASIYEEDVFTSQCVTGEKTEGQFTAAVILPQPFLVSFGPKESKYRCLQVHVTV